MTMQQARRNPTSIPKRSRKPWHVTDAEIERALAPLTRQLAGRPLNLNLMAGMELVRRIPATPDSPWPMVELRRVRPL